MRFSCLLAVLGSMSAAAPAQVVNPAVISSSYLGGSSMEFSPQIALTPTGEIIVAASTTSTDFPMVASLDPTHNGARDVVIARFDPTGSTLLNSTYLGGAGHEFAEGMAIDAAGNIYLTGRTTSPDFPTTASAYNPGYNGGETDLYLAKISADGSQLIFSTFLGGTDVDLGLGVTVDAAGAVYVTGTTLSADFPTTPGVLDRTFNGGFQDGFVAKFDAAATSLLYSTYIGSDSTDVSERVEVDAAGQAHLVGYTDGPNFPVTPGAFDTTFNGGFFTGQELWVAKLDASASSLVYATYLGGSGREFFADLALDASGNAYITGRTSSPNFPITPAAYDTSFNGGASPEPFDGFVTKLNLSGSTLLYSTFLGGSGTDAGIGIAVDAAGTAFVSGGTLSPDFPLTCGCFDGTFSLAEGFITRLDPAGSALMFSTFAGGSGSDFAFEVSSSAGGLGVIGITNSADFPTTAGAYDVTFNGGEFDLTVMKLDPSLLSLQGALQQMIDSVERLAEVGTLNQGQANSLTSKLEAAINSLDKGNTGAAANQLEAFSNQVAALEKAGTLSPAEAKSLTDAASCNLAQI